VLAGITTTATGAEATNKPWFGVHVGLRNDAQAKTLTEQLPKLAALGVNVLIVEVNYEFQFKSYPQLGNPAGLSKKAAGELAAACRENKIRPIPQLNCVGHQSWSAVTASLLKQFPEFDETPGKYPRNQGIYCRSWCPLHPQVNQVVFALMDELIDAFQADAFHVGMDEIFLIATDDCPRCKGKDPAEVLAKAIDDYHAHLVTQRKLEMLMWSDRLLDAKITGYGKWEAAENGTAPAIDRIPKDIIMCDWHYGKRNSYPSIRILIDKGFRVWPGGWDNVQATEALIAGEKQQTSPLMLGHMCTTWGKPKLAELAQWPPIVAAAKEYAGK